MKKKKKNSMNMLEEQCPLESWASHKCTPPPPNPNNVGAGIYIQYPNGDPKQYQQVVPITKPKKKPSSIFHTARTLTSNVNNTTRVAFPTDYYRL